jgi:hypothetical protein
MAVKEPSADGPLPQKGNDSLVAVGLKGAFEHLHGAGITGAGIPLLAVSDHLGDHTASAKRWQIILSAVDSAGPASGIRRVVLGAWGIDDGNRTLYRNAFAQAWSTWVIGLDQDRITLAREPLRLTLILALLACAASAMTNRPFSAMRIAAILSVAAGTVLGSIGGLFDIVTQLLPGKPEPVLVAGIKLAVAVVAGLALDKFVQFKEKEKKLVIGAE